MDTKAHEKHHTGHADDGHSDHKEHEEQTGHSAGMHADGHKSGSHSEGAHKAGGHKAGGHKNGGHKNGGHAAHTDHTGHEQMFRQRFWVCLALTVPVLIYSEMLQNWFNFSPPTFPGSGWIGPVFSLIVFAYGGVPFLQMAVPEVQNRKPGMMTLISLAISVAFVYSLAALVIPGAEGFFWELVTLIDIMLLGHWLEMRSVRQASGALNELAKLMPDTAERLRDDGSTESVPVSELSQGDLLLVRPGESVPADGEVVEGRSAVNEAMITGESRPVEKEAGAQVIAGTINGDGSLRVRVTATGDETALAGIMRLVDEAQQSKSATQVLADKAAGWLFYAAVAAAVVTAVAWVVADASGFDVVKRVATVLVIACPHALGLAVPLVVAISTSLAAGNGILIRDRIAMEEARNLDAIIFDKTGTLTKGEFGVVDMAVADGWDADEALALTAAVEGDSEHTIAQGIRRSAEEKELSLPEVKDFEALKGRGVRATSNGHTLHVGGPRLLEYLELSLPQKFAQFDEEASAKGQSVVHLVQDEEIVAAFALADVIRQESREAVQRLHEMGLEVAILTGDSRAVAQAVAAELGVDQFFAEVLPEHKDEKVQELQSQGKRVAMVGDGVNDAPALTRADVGIAIGSGTDVAVESADIVLVQSNPLDAVKIVELSRATRSKMVQNLWWAAGYNVFAIPLAAGILVPFGLPALSPAVGALLMSLSTIVVAINAQFLRRVELVQN